jgi:hypothetical protein
VQVARAPLALERRFEHAPLSPCEYGDAAFLRVIAAIATGKFKPDRHFKMYIVNESLHIVKYFIVRHHA